MTGPLPPGFTIKNGIFVPETVTPKVFDKKITGFIPFEDSFKTDDKYSCEIIK